MKERATRLWGWVRSHRFWSSVLLIALLIGLGFGVNLVRFGLPPPMGQNCGSILYAGISQTARADANLKPLACFWQAYQTCRAATISQTIEVTDGGSTDTVTTEQRDSSCALYGQHEGWGSGNVLRLTTTFLCTQLSKVGDNLQVSACDGITSFALAASYIPQDSFPCGRVGYSSSIVYKTPQKIEGCFFAAYQ